jgi:hypothetical protein
VVQLGPPIGPASRVLERLRQSTDCHCVAPRTLLVGVRRGLGAVRDSRDGPEPVLLVRVVRTGSQLFDWLVGPGSVGAARLAVARCIAFSQDRLLGRSEKWYDICPASG